MQNYSPAKVVKISSPFHYTIQTLEESPQILHIQLKPAQNKHYQHLIAKLYDTSIQYYLLKKPNIQLRSDAYVEGSIIFEGKDIRELYQENYEKVYVGQFDDTKDILCFVAKVECLRLELLDLKSSKYLTFYFSELKLIKTENIHPKQMWEKAQQYYRQQLEGQYVHLQIGGTEKYKEELNIYGEIYSKGKVNFKDKFVEDGYAEINKNAHKYISAERIKILEEKGSKVKSLKKGVWKQKKAKGGTQALEFRYKQWQEWCTQQKSINQIKNEDEQIKKINEQLSKQNNQKPEYQKLKILIDTIIILFEGETTRKTFRDLEQLCRSFTNIMLNFQIAINSNVENIEFLKNLCKVITFFIFYLEEIEKMSDKREKQKFMKPSCSEIEKLVKFLFKLSFLGNQTFHDKLFGKKKDYDYENFNFDNVHLNSGFSSLSEASENEDTSSERSRNAPNKKQNSAYLKLRLNSTMLLSQIFKHYPTIVESYWEMCVTSNKLTPQFLGFLHMMKISTENHAKIKSQSGRKEIIRLMMTNFGDLCLVLLVVFERNAKVKTNALNCVLNMIDNFKGKKLIDTTESSYIQKLLNETKSSFVPKSFIIFSGLRNALYFLLFSLHYQKSLPIIMLIFKTLNQICNTCTLIEKMSFEDGIGLLMKNYIVPILEYDWGVVELEELKGLCINFLAVLVSSNKKWPQIEEKYLSTTSSCNLNSILLEIIQTHPLSGLTIEILGYFTKLTKQYFHVFFITTQNLKVSIWDKLVEIFLSPETNVCIQFCEFVEEVFKCEVDISRKENRRIPENNDYFGKFLEPFLKKYVEEVTIGNYLHLIGLLSYVDYSYWSSKDYTFAREFLVNCFDNFTNKKPIKTQFPSIEPLLSNSLIRLSLLKLLGYMSFCPEFQQQDYLQTSVKCLLQHSATQKSLNSIIKITWGLSNWSKVQGFGEALTEEELEKCLKYLIKHSESDREKIASNCTRGIGFFMNINNIGKKFSMEDCRKSIIKNLGHTILKVRTNSTKTLMNMAHELSSEQISDILPTLEENILKNNFHLQTETIHFLKTLGNPLSKERLLKLYVTVLKNLMKSTTMEYEFSEIRTIKNLRHIMLNEFFELICQFSHESILKNMELLNQCLLSVYTYLVMDLKPRDPFKQEQSSQNYKQKEHQKSDEAQKLIFNLSKFGKAYDEEDQIQTKANNKLIVAEVSQADILLINKIKDFSSKEGKELGEGWSKLKQVRVHGQKVQIEAGLLVIQQGEEE